MLVQTVLIMVIIFLGFRIYNHIRYDIWSALEWSYFGGKERYKLEEKKRSKKLRKAGRR